MLIAEYIQESTSLTSLVKMFLFFLFQEGESKLSSCLLNPMVIFVHPKSTLLYFHYRQILSESNYDDGV